MTLNKSFIFRFIIKLPHATSLYKGNTNFIQTYANVGVNTRHFRAFAPVEDICVFKKPPFKNSKEATYVIIYNVDNFL